MQINKCRIIFLLTILLSFASFAVLVSSVSAMDGAGTAADPYIVKTPQDLDSIRNNMSAHYKLDAHINLTGFDAGDGMGWMPIGNDASRFTGSFDGAGYTIKGLTINRVTDQNGLFGYSSGAVFKNIGLLDVDITGKSYNGALVSYLASRGSISNSYATGKVTATSNYTGGLAGRVNGTVTDSYSLVNVKGYDSVGGFIGRLESSSTINRSYAAGTLLATKSSSPLVGGITSQTDANSVTDSYWNTQISGQSISSGGGAGKTTAEMKQQATYVGWDFDNVWQIVEGLGYPELKLFAGNEEEPVVPILDSIYVIGKVGELYKNSNTQLNVYAKYTNSTVTDITYLAQFTSNLPHIANVSSDGLVTAISAGTANITIEAWDFTDHFVLNVKETPELSNIKFMEDLITDPSLVFTIPVLGKPDYLVPFVDPTFGTQITRITGDNPSTFNFSSSGSGVWGNDARQRYSKEQAWNSDGTLISLQNRDGTGVTPKVIYLDGETYEPKFPVCSNYNGWDDRWHPAKDHPYERINVVQNGTAVTWFNIVTCTETNRISLPFIAAEMGKGEGNPSLDGRYLVLSDKADKNIYVIDMETGQIGPPRAIDSCGLSDCSTDWVSVSPSGKYAAVSYEGDYLRVFDINKTTLQITPRPMPTDTIVCSQGSLSEGYIFDVGHADMALNPFDNFEDVIVGQYRNWCPRSVDGEALGRVVMVNLKDNKVTNLTNPSNEAYSHHISTRSFDNPGWAYVSYYKEVGKRYSNEVIAVKLDGSKEVKRFAHSHSTGTPYRNEVHPTPSLDGTRIIFASGWDADCGSNCGTSGTPKAYVIDARPKSEDPVIPEIPEPEFMEGLITDPSLQFTIPNVPKPGYLAPILDPTFKTVITRIADDAGTSFTFSAGGNGGWGTDVRQHYQRIQPWNSDGTLIQLENRGTGGSGVVYLDGETYLPKYGKCSNYDMWDDRWHPSKDHPNEMINVKGNLLTWFDVVQCMETKRIVLPFNADNFGGGKGNPTADGRYVVMADKNNNANKIYLIDMELGIVGPATVVSKDDCQSAECNLSWGSITPSGKYVIAHYSGDFHRVYDVNLSNLTLTPRSLPANSPSCQNSDAHSNRNPALGYLFDLGHADIVVNAYDNNEEYMVGVRRSWCKTADGNNLGTAVMVRIKDNKVTSLTSPTNEGYAKHMSGQASERPGWVYVTYEVSNGRFNSEVIAIKMDGSNEMQRFAHHHSTQNPYRNESHGVPSRDGTRVIFASGWDSNCGDGCGSNENPQAYVIDARPRTSDPITPPEEPRDPSGSGTLLDPYIVKTVEDLDKIRENLTAHYKLGANIDLTNYDSGDGKGWLPIGHDTPEKDKRFKGSLDGAGYVITGLTINRAGDYTVGLFGYADASMFKNIGLDNVNITGGNYVGALTGYMGGSASLVGISNVHATGQVVGTTGSSYAGGIVGATRPQIIDSYAIVNVTSAARAGGIAGYLDEGSIDTSFAAGEIIGVTVGEVGGLAGRVKGNTVTDSYWDIETSGQVTSPGGGTGKSTEDMMKEATFVGFDFQNVWKIDEGADYPKLRVIAETTGDNPSEEPEEPVDPEEPTMDFLLLVELIEGIVNSGDLKGPLVNQVKNGLDQAAHHWEKGNFKQAVKHLEDIIKHLNNKGLQEHATEATKIAIIETVNKMIAVWSN